MADREERPGVVVVGSVHTDFVATAHRLPVRGETMPGHRFAIHPGGKGGNQAIAAAQAGARAFMLGRVGADRFGRDLRESLLAKLVDVRWLGEDLTEPTGASAVLTGEDGDYASVMVPGASLCLTPALVRAARPAFVGSRVVLAQLEIAIDATHAALRLGRELGLTTVLNAAPAPDDPAELPAELWNDVDVAIANQGEGEAIVGSAPSAEAGLLDAARRLRQRLGVPWAIVTGGAEGAAVAGIDGCGWLEPGHAVTPIDAIGAGDAFAGALAAALADGHAMRDAVRAANATGAIAVTRAGGYDAAATAAEVAAFLDSRRR